MDYGTYQIPLYRVWQPATKSYVHGLAGSLHGLRIAFHDWLCNEFCDGYNPKTHVQDGDDPSKEELTRRYNAARRRFRIVPVKVRVADDWQHTGCLSVVAI